MRVIEDVSELGNFNGRACTRLSSWLLHHVQVRCREATALKAVSEVPDSWSRNGLDELRCSESSATALHITYGTHVGHYIRYPLLPQYPPERESKFTHI